MKAKMSQLYLVDLLYQESYGRYFEACKHNKEVTSRSVVDKLFGFPVFSSTDNFFNTYGNFIAYYDQFLKIFEILFIFQKICCKMKGK